MDELRDAAERAVAELRQWTGEDPEVSIRVVERGGLTVTLAQPSELPGALDVRDLSRVETMSIEVGRYRPKAEIRLVGGWLGEGMRLSVVGEDKTRVEGLAKQLSDVLTPRHAVGVPGLHGLGIMFALAGASVGAAFAGRFMASYVLEVDSYATRLLIVLGFVVLVTAVVVLAVWTGPPVEILEPGKQSRYVRWRGRILTLAGTIVLGVPTSIVATMLYSGN